MATMTRDKAAIWLRQVNGHTMRNSTPAEDGDSWVSLVRVPTGSGLGGSTLIVAFGPTMEDATRAAEERWHALWRASGPAN